MYFLLYFRELPVWHRFGTGLAPSLALAYAYVAVLQRPYRLEA